MHSPLPTAQDAPTALSAPPAADAPAAGMLPAAWLQLDASALVVEAGTGALALLAANVEVLLLQCRRLRATRQPERLQQALLLAKLQGRCPLALVRSQRLPLTLLCEHLQAGDPAAGDPAAGWRITLRDPEAERPDRRLLQALFGLTPSEAEVAGALAGGRSTGEIALLLGVQTNTVLAHVKKVLTKTGTQRQAQLVSLLLRSVAMVSSTAPTPAPAPTNAPACAPGGLAARPAVAGLARDHPPDTGWAPPHCRHLAHSGNDTPAEAAHTDHIVDTDRWPWRQVQHGNLPITGP